jgi:hypothetical protein
MCPVGFSADGSWTPLTAKKRVVFEVVGGDVDGLVLDSAVETQRRWVEDLLLLTNNGEQGNGLQGTALAKMMELSPRNDRESIVDCDYVHQYWVTEKLDERDSVWIQLTYRGKKIVLPEITPTLLKRNTLLRVIELARNHISPSLGEYSKWHHAIWDVREDQDGNEILSLEISDDHGSATADYSVIELQEDSFGDRFNELIEEMLRRSRPPKIRIEMRDVIIDNPPWNDSPFNSAAIQAFRNAIITVEGVKSAELGIGVSFRNGPRNLLWELKHIIVDADAAAAESIRELVRDFGLRIKGE